MHQSKAFNIVAIILAVALAYISAFALAICAGIGLGLFGRFFVNDKGESFFLAFLVFTAGAVPSLIGGLLAAWFAGHREYLHSLSFGLIYLAILGAMAIAGPDSSSWSDILHFVLVIPLSLLGGIIIAQRRAQARTR